MRFTHGFNFLFIPSTVCFLVIICHSKIDYIPQAYLLISKPLPFKKPHIFHVSLHTSQFYSHIKYDHKRADNSRVYDTPIPEYRPYFFEFTIQESDPGMILFLSHLLLLDDQSKYGSFEAPSP